MRKLLLTTAAFITSFGAATAQDLTLSGFMEFESHYGINYDNDAPATGSSVTGLDFAVDGRLQLDYATSAQSGIEYGAHLELDLHQSDGELESFVVGAPAHALAFRGDIAAGDLIELNDGYVFVKSSLGEVSLGDTGLAGRAQNQLHVPILTKGAFELDQVRQSMENEQVFYSNRFFGVEIEAATDDDMQWSLGLGHSASVGGAKIELGLSAGRSTLFFPSSPEVHHLAGSLEAQIGGLTAGVNYGSSVADGFQTIEYIATGASYEMGALTLGAGVETTIYHFSFFGNQETYISNLFAGLAYELADGLTLAAGIGNLDADSPSNWANFGTVLNGGSTPVRARSTNAIASVRVDF